MRSISIQKHILKLKKWVQQTSLVSLKIINLFTPASESILPSITKYSLLYIAKERLGMEAIEGDVYIDQLDQFAEAGACGTAAVITPVGGIQHKGKFHVFYSETEVGPVTRKLYNELTGIQFGDVEAPEGWIVKVE